MQELEKIMEEIKTEKKKHWDPADESDKIIGWCFDKCMDIVRNHMNDGWIPVEEQLPDVTEGTEDPDCPEFNVMIKGASRSTTLKYSWDGTWFDDNGYLYDVIAWQPLPEPYRPERSEGE